MIMNPSVIYRTNRAQSTVSALKSTCKKRIWICILDLRQLISNFVVLTNDKFDSIINMTHASASDRECHQKYTHRSLDPSKVTWKVKLTFKIGLMPFLDLLNLYPVYLRGAFCLIAQDHGSVARNGSKILFKNKDKEL